MAEVRTVLRNRFTVLCAATATILVGVALYPKIGSEFRNMEEISGAGVYSILLSPGLYLPLGLLIAVTLVGWYFTHDGKD